MLSKAKSVTIISMRKKIVLFVFFSLLTALLLFGCTDKKSGYFNDFASHGQFAEAKAGLTLPVGTSVHSYDVNNDVFVTKRTVVNGYDGTNMEVYGLASYDTEYIQPIYSSIAAIKGDYAVVYKNAKYEVAGEENFVNTVGVIRFRGKNTGELTDFSPVDSSVNQFSFVGKYVVALGLKDATYSSANFSTFYDYSQGRLLEKFRLRCGPDYEFLAEDGYIVAIGPDHAFFYNVKDNVNGYLIPNEKSGYYMPYPEDTEGEFTDLIDVEIYYLGNGWFARTGRLESEEQFYGYTMTYEKMDYTSGESKLVYANVRSDLFNIKTGATVNREWLVVAGVANKYSADYYTQFASYLNSLANFDEDTGLYDYDLPYLNPASSVKDGYSIVYYYYLPYADDGNYASEITFCIMNDKAEIINVDDMLMPAVFVDGHGVETSDPLYEKYYGAVSVFDTGLVKTELVPYKEKESTYASYFYHGKGVVASEINYKKNDVLFGVTAPDGTRLIDFEYHELTPFYGEYAIGSKKATAGKTTYRVDANGNKTLLDDVLKVCDGVYVCLKYGKMGVKNYEGAVLIEADNDSVEVIQNFLVSGSFQTDYAVATKNNVTTIYRLL